MENTDTFRLFAVTPPGLEPITAQELTNLGLLEDSVLDRVLPGNGGVDFSGGLKSLYCANYQLRTATRILVRLGQFHASKFVELRRKIANLPWETVLPNKKPIMIRATCHQSRLYHSGAVAQRTMEGIGDRLGKMPLVEKATDIESHAALILVRLVNDECTISIDSSGTGLDRRGYRLALGKAPLRETLAAGMLIASQWDKTSPLLDPFCGSGVIPIEAALMAANIPPNPTMLYAFMDWPGYDQSIMRSVVLQAEQRKTIPTGPIFGSDRDAGVIKMAQENAARAGVEQWIIFDQKAVSAITPPSIPGWVVTNPPYGVRISSNSDIRNLYASFGKILSLRCPGWNVAFLCNEDRLATMTHLNFSKGLSLNNGGIPVKLNMGTVPG